MFLMEIAAFAGGADVLLIATLEDTWHAECLKAQFVVDDLEQLRAAIAECRRSERETHEFISLLAHDLRTPLTSIRGYTQLMLRLRPGQPPLDPSIESGLTTIIEQSDRLAAMTNMLLDVCRIRLERVALRSTAVDVSSVVRAVLTGSSVEHEIDAPDRGPLIAADGSRVQQMITTMVTFLSGRNGGTLPLRVSVGEQDSGGAGSAVVTLRDGGSPLEPELASHLFDRLARKQPDSEVWQLAHPDLFVAHGIARAHGGAIECRSPVEADRGVELTLTLPVEHHSSSS